MKNFTEAEKREIEQRIQAALPGTMFNGPQPEFFISEKSEAGIAIGECELQPNMRIHVVSVIHGSVPNAERMFQVGKFFCMN